VVERDQLRALWRVLRYRPVLTVAIGAFGVGTALLEAVGVGFVLPVVELARASGPPPDGGPLGAFTRVYALLGVPFTLETVLVGAAAAIGVRYGATVAMAWVRIRLQTDYERHLKRRAFDRALHAEVAYFDERGSDEVLNAIVTQAGEASAVIRYLTDLVEHVLISATYLAVALYLAPRLTVVTVLAFAVITVVVRSVVESGQSVGTALADADEAIQTAAQSGTKGVREAKLYGMVADLSARFERALDRRVDAQVGRERNREAVGNAYYFASAVAIFALTYAVIEFTSLSLGSIGVYLFALFQLAPRVSSINNTVYHVETRLPQLRRTHEFVDELAARREPEGAAAPVPDPVESVAFDGVEFAYRPDEPVLRGVDFSAERGEFVAFVGQSGAGKSTVAALLARFYEPDEGQILANGRPVAEFDVREWRERLGVVRQDPHVFDETLWYNLTVGVDDPSRAAVEHACDLAQVTEFLSELPDGLQTRLGDDGVRLSGGQRQRVALARALLTDADVLVLDEATSDLDTRIERRVQRAIEAADREFLLVAIAHRLSTVRNADRIYAVEDGEIVEAGTHRELIEAEGAYARLYAGQDDD
jgi:subfamily B ATP-binding cassette protein MsbA